VCQRFELEGNDVHTPGVHICSKGHMFETRLYPAKGEPTVDTDAVERIS
jgi:hypothetical protein